jgi:hypothetical protein
VIISTANAFQPRALRAEQTPLVAAAFTLLISAQLARQQLAAPYTAESLEVAAQGYGLEMKLRITKVEKLHREAFPLIAWLRASVFPEMGSRQGPAGASACRERLVGTIPRRPLPGAQKGRGQQLRQGPGRRRQLHFTASLRPNSIQNGSPQRKKPGPLMGIPAFSDYTAPWLHRSCDSDRGQF